MLFSEPAFVFFFFPLLCLVYYWLPQRARNLWLLLASLFFYWWGERLFILMLISIGMNYGFGLLLDPQRQSKKPQLWLWIAVFANLGFLGFYKYGNFVFEILNDLRLGMGWQPLDQKSSIHLPIGISFYTFQALSYVLDVHRGQAPAQRNPLSLGLYISLFPQLIMGPIVRYCDIAGQIAKRHICWRFRGLRDSCAN